MVSMSYCRFENTEQEINACLNAIDEREEISKEENECANRMFKHIIKWLDDNGVIDLDDNDDPHLIEDILLLCKGK